jgi:hypothetical protein
VKRYNAALCSNPRKAEELRETLQTAGSLMAIFRQLLYCGYEDKASEIAKHIRDVAGCNDDCDCKDCGDPCDPRKILPIVNTDAAVQDIIVVSGINDAEVTLDDSVPGIQNWVVNVELPDIPAAQDVVEVLAGTGGVTVDVDTGTPGITKYTVNVEHPDIPPAGDSVVVSAGTPNVTVTTDTGTPGVTEYIVSVSETATTEVSEASIAFSSSTLIQRDGPAQFPFDLNFVKKSPEIATVTLSINGAAPIAVTINSATVTASISADDYLEWEVTLAGGETRGSISYRINYT